MKRQSLAAAAAILVVASLFAALPAHAGGQSGDFGAGDSPAGGGRSGDFGAYGYGYMGTGQTATGNAIEGRMQGMSQAEWDAHLAGMRERGLTTYSPVGKDDYGGASYGSFGEMMGALGEALGFGGSDSIAGDGGDQP